MRSRAFTLIELLTVIAVVALLATLLFPSFSKAKFQARNTSCKNNLHQVGLALQLYTSTYEAYPRLTTRPDASSPELYYWDQLLEPYVSSKPDVMLFNYGSSKGRITQPVLVCPFFRKSSPDIPSDGIHVGIVYGYNSHGIGGFDEVEGQSNTLGLSNDSYLPGGLPTPAVREAAVVSPSQMIASGDPFGRALNKEYDATFLHGAGWRPIRTAPTGMATVPDRIQKSPKAVRLHHALFNKAFCDGHVDSEDFKRVFSPTDDYLRRWNNDNEAHRERWN